MDLECCARTIGRYPVLSGLECSAAKICPASEVIRGLHHHSDGPFREWMFPLTDEERRSFSVAG